MKMSNGIEILCDSHHGQYLPQIWAQQTENLWGINIDNWETLRTGPLHEWYWETWETVLNGASYTDKNGNVWTLYQDGDLFAVCESLMSAEDKRNFFDEY